MKHVDRDLETTRVPATLPELIKVALAIRETEEEPWVLFDRLLARAAPMTSERLAG
jgi:hypothetical protein